MVKQALYYRGVGQVTRSGAGAGRAVLRSSRRRPLGVEQAGLVRGDDELDPVSGTEFGQ